jgi:glycosyltransferase involved in cell wall biosynthesis
VTRVLHVLEALEGGTSRHLIDLVRFTPETEQHVVVPPRRVGALTDERALSALRAAGATVHVVAMTRRPASGANARALRTLVRLVRRTAPDLLHTHSSVGGALGRAAAVLSRTPVVYTPNGVYPARGALVIERALGRVTDRLVAVSDSEAELVRRLNLVDPARLAIIPNGIDPVQPANGPDLRALAGVPPDAPLVVSVGRLVPQKAPLDVIAALGQALRARPTAYALLVGDGDLRTQVDAARLGLDLDDRLRYLPFVPDVAAGLGTADVALLLSHFEGAPYVPLEAMRAGVAVVATDVVGTRDVVVQGETGVLVPMGDTRAAALAVVGLLDAPDRRAAMGQAGQRRVLHERSAVAMGGAHADLYATLT